MSIFFNSTEPHPYQHLFCLLPSPSPSISPTVRVGALSQQVLPVSSADSTKTKIKPMSYYNHHDLQTISPNEPKPPPPQQNYTRRDVTQSPTHNSL